MSAMKSRYVRFSAPQPLPMSQFEKAALDVQRSACGRNWGQVKFLRHGSEEFLATEATEGTEDEDKIQIDIRPSTCPSIFDLSLTKRPRSKFLDRGRKIRDRSNSNAMGSRNFSHGGHRGHGG